MTTGDIIIIPTMPPHLASVISPTEAMCEDGVIRPYPQDSVVAYTALEMLQALESGVTNSNDAR